jgi:hypothetical protein
MTLTRRLWCGMWWAAFMLAGSPAQAFYLSGSFSGTAQAEGLPLNFTPPRPESFYDGAVVSGTFEVHVPDPQFQVGSDSHAYYLNGNGGWLSLTYDIKDARFQFRVDTPPPTFPTDASVILLTPALGADSFQSVMFLTTFMPKYDGASFQLRGPSGSLFDGLDATTLRFPTGTPPAFSTGFSSSEANMRVTVDVSQVTFQNTSPVPEPGTTVLFLAGCCALLAWRKLYQRAFRPLRPVHTTA